jgi:hypothetical protein
MSATPRPWTAHCDHLLGGQGDAMSDAVVARFLRTEDRDLALHAVNCFDELIAALEEIKRDAPQNSDVRLRLVREIARAALSSAKGEPS